MGTKLRILMVPGDANETGTSEQSTSSYAIGCLGVIALGLLWLLLLVLGLVGAIPYGGSNEFFTLWVALTWGIVIYVLVRIAVKILDAIKK